ncbi:small heat shock protein [Russula aff. rugulosa BPL654]|nr:small heat shock protein [Russula aff. rugulosa BPL654]
MSLTHYLFNDYSPTDRFIDEMFANRTYRPNQQLDVFRPRMDIRHDEKANSVTATFDLPGMQKKDVSIDIHNNILSVSGETKGTAEKEEEGFTLRERRYGKFSRSLSLPQGTKNEDIRASMNNGVLEVTFPRSVPETTPSKINIS